MLRRLSIAIVLGLLAASGVASAQDEPTLPKRPVPYTQIRPKPPKPKARPAPSPALETPTLTAQRAPAATPAPVAPPPVPVAKTAAPAVAQPPAAPPVVQAANIRVASAQPLPPAQLEAFVDGWMADAMNRDHVPGAAVSIVQNGQVVLKKGYGFADLKTGRRVDPDRTLFRLASISKTFTWILVMRDVEAGRMRLDRPVNLYLPEKVRLRRDGRRGDVTLLHLMAHAGGFEDRALGQLFERNPDRVRPLDLYLRQERPQRIWEPGALSSYSNYGAALAGEAASFVAGRTFERRVEDEITGPLAMAHTTFREPRPARRALPAPMAEALRADLAGGYRWTGAGFEPRDFEFAGQIAPAGSASSTAGDMSRYMLTMLGNGTWNGVSVYGPLAAHAFRTPIRPMPEGLNGWAHGLMVYSLPGGYRGYGHDGATVSFHSRLVVIPALNLGVFVTTSSDGGDDLIHGFVGQLLREFYVGPGPTQRAGSPQLAEARKTFAGDFVNTRRAFSGLEGFVTLLGGGTRVAVTSDGRLITSDLGATRAWVPDGPLAAARFVDVQGDSRIAFGMRHGRATSFYDPDRGAVSVRAPFWQGTGLLGALAALTGAAAAATLAGVAVRNRRDFRENPTQARAALVQNMQAGLWLAALALFGLWSLRLGDFAKVIFDWPGMSMVLASTCALVAALLSLPTIVALPAVWRGGRRVDSWPPLRRAYFTATVLIYAAFSVLLALWGALEPWSG